MKNKIKLTRPHISPDIQLRLWTNSAGRCQFQGCSKYLLKDGLTLKKAKYSNISHIISWTSNGPRGHKELSPKLAAEYSNLMLTCLDHGRLIDQKEYESEYPVELLTKWKNDHEEKVKMLMDKYGQDRTEHLILLSKIDGKVTDVNFDQVLRAVAPRYPRNETGTILDYTNFDPDNDKTLDAIRDKITNKVNRLLDSGSEYRPDHISILGFAPLPLMFHLGFCISNKVQTDLYQHHRDTDSWEWKNDEDDDFDYQVITHKTAGKKVALLLSLSGKIHLEEINNLIDTGFSVYEITIVTPSRYFLTSRSRLEKFKRVFSELLTMIRAEHGSDTEIHIFPAVPIPVAIASGQEIISKSDPDVYIYDNHKTTGGFKKILKLN